MNPTTTRGGELLPSERELLLAELERTAAALSAAVEGLSAEQWCSRPAADTWSVAEIVDHLAKIEVGSFGLQQRLLTMPALPSVDSSRDGVLRERVATRGERIEAPEFVRPAVDCDGPAALDRFHRARRRTIEYIASTNAPLRLHAAPHPFAGPLDGYQWIVMLCAHVERHLEQIASTLRDVRS